MGKEKKKRTKDVVATLLHNRPVSAKKLVPRITIPLDEYEFLRDVVDAARSVSDAYGLSNLRALHFAVARLETLLEKSSVLTERGAEELDVTNHSGTTEKQERTDEELTGNALSKVFRKPSGELCERLEKSIGPALGKKGKKQ